MYVCGPKQTRTCDIWRVRQDSKILDIVCRIHWNTGNHEVLIGPHMYGAQAMMV